MESNTETRDTNHVRYQVITAFFTNPSFKLQLSRLGYNKGQQLEISTQTPAPTAISPRGPAGTDVITSADVSCLPSSVFRFPHRIRRHSGTRLELEEIETW